MSKYPIFTIPPLDLDNSESRLEGAIDKYWIDIPDLGYSLIKHDNRGAWVEKIAAALAQAIDLPAVDYQLGVNINGSKAIISQNFLLNNAIEIPGEELLLERFGKNYLYTPDNAIAVVSNTDIELPLNIQKSPAIETASDLLTGYFIFDSWIGNIDRHGKNWSIQQTLDGTKKLIESFDHGLSLGNRMPDDKLPIDIDSFWADSQSSLYGEVGGRLTMTDLADRLLELHPAAAKYWIDRIAALDRLAIESIFDRMPENWISDLRTKFSIDLLVASQKRLVEISESK